MQKVTEYFGESYDATDPGKVLRVIRDFMLLFDKAIFEIQVCVHVHQTLQHIVFNQCDGGHALIIWYKLGEQLLHSFSVDASGGCNATHSCSVLL